MDSGEEHPPGEEHQPGATKGPYSFYKLEQYSNELKTVGALSWQRSAVSGFDADLSVFLYPS